MSLCLTENNSCLCSNDTEAEQDALLETPGIMDGLSKLTLNLRALNFLDTTMKVITKTTGFGNPSPERRNSDGGEVKGFGATGDKCEKKDLATISLDEVAWHDSMDDCWMVIYDYVYDCTNFMKNHPGGPDILLEYSGRDATLAFIGTGHSKAAFRILEKYLIGELPVSERLFRTPNGIKILNV